MVLPWFGEVYNKSFFPKGWNSSYYPNKIKNIQKQEYRLWFLSFFSNWECIKSSLQAVSWQKKTQEKKGKAKDYRGNIIVLTGNHLGKKNTEKNHKLYLYVLQRCNTYVPFGPTCSSATLAVRGSEMISLSMVHLFGNIVSCWQILTVPFA